MKKILTMLATAVVLAGCYNDSVEELYPAPVNPGGGGGCDTATVTFSGSIKPIINAQCAISGCHDAATIGGGFDMSTYDGVKKAAGRMVGAINWETGYSAMPKGMNKLDACNIAKMRKWVGEGALNN